MAQIYHPRSHHESPERHHHDPHRRLRYGLAIVIAVLGLIMATALSGA